MNFEKVLKKRIQEGKLCDEIARIDHELSGKYPNDYPVGYFTLELPWVHGAEDFWVEISSSLKSESPRNRHHSSNNFSIELERFLRLITESRLIFSKIESGEEILTNILPSSLFGCELIGQKPKTKIIKNRFKYVLIKYTKNKMYKMPWKKFVEMVDSAAVFFADALEKGYYEHEFYNKKQPTQFRGEGEYIPPEYELKRVYIYPVKKKVKDAE